MRTAFIATLLGSAACSDVDLGPRASVAVASRDFQVTITGCAEAGLLGCEVPGTMEAVLDGTTREVPPSEPSFPLGGRTNELTLPSPEDPDIKLVLDGVGVHVNELPWFELELAGAGAVHRADGPVRLVFDAFR